MRNEVSIQNENNTRNENPQNHEGNQEVRLLQPKGAHGHNLRIFRKLIKGKNGGEEGRQRYRHGQKGNGNVTHKLQNRRHLHPFTRYDLHQAEELEGQKKGHKEGGGKDKGRNKVGSEIALYNRYREYSSY